MPIHVAHQLTARQTAVRKSGALWSASRRQVTGLCTLRRQHTEPSRHIVLSTQHDEEIGYDDLQDAVIEEIIKPVIPKR